MIHDAMARLRRLHPRAWTVLKAAWLLLLLIAVWELWGQPPWALRYLGL